ncbi:hypothetical protein [Testudinibacter aquarius]|uniref:Uncharacterized protein n=1 Tax=Testudinibacter aquarius TaxID=1524974 RepID=A0A4R3Y5Q7_9PAST|nr:hypothetical protein [Testudinibacter aquarius]KAE9526285.1 hypothetical protein A1D24_02470 [Testudinibacter aquarius]TCV87097.1 hypothetical protein EDC16_10514 [Testudinibacter aquarius]TNG85588.1 hypothetical protein FHQ21_12625 [Testudinibacter aquarius]
MLLTPGGKKGKGNNNNHIAEPNNKPKAENNSNKKADGEDGNTTKPRSHAPESNTKKGSDGSAYAEGGDAPIKPKKTKLEAGTPEHKAQRWK